MRDRRARVLIADDHLIMAEEIRDFLANRYEIVAIVQNGYAAVEAAQQLKPDIVLLDISMPGIDGIQVAVRLRRTVPDSKILFVTHHSDRGFVAAAFCLGAHGYVTKHAPHTELITALEQVQHGFTYISRDISKSWVSSIGQRGRCSEITMQRLLSKRQEQVLQCLAEGMRRKEIAAELNISPKTVDEHRAVLMRILGLHSAAELSRYALRHDWLNRSSGSHSVPAHQREISLEPPTPKACYPFESDDLDHISRRKRKPSRRDLPVAEAGHVDIGDGLMTVVSPDEVETNCWHG